MTVASAAKRQAYQATDQALRADLYQNWTKDYLIPIAQNLTASLAVSATFGVSAIILITDNVNAAFDVAFVAGVVAFGFSTCIRFFGDELGILRQAHNEGRRSRDGEIERLEHMLYNAEAALNEAQRMPEITPTGTRNGQQILDATADAEKIIGWQFDGKSVSRRECAARGIKQARFQRAIECLHNAQIMQDGQWVSGDRGAALKALAAHYKANYVKSQRHNSVTPL